MLRSNHKLLLLLITFPSAVIPEGILEENPEKYDHEIFYRNAYNPYQFFDDTNFTMEEYEDADPCWPDPCNRGGFCYRLLESSYSCDCLSTREGSNCEYAYVDFAGGLQSSNFTEVPEIDPRCDGIDCNGNGECVLINVGTLGLSEYEASCGCSMGYSEEDDCLTWTGCDKIACSNNGICVDGEINGVKTVGCICDSGWTGETCAIGQRECTEAVFVNMINQLAEFDQEVALTCSDIWPFVPYVSTHTSICTCLNAVAQNIPDFMDENTCVLDNRYYHSLETLSDIHKQYCNGCSDQEIESNLETIFTKSNICEYYYEYRQDMPLYMNSYWRCQCYATLGVSREEVEQYLSCRMLKESFLSTEMISMSNCELEFENDHGISFEWMEEFSTGEPLCDYEDVYEKLKTELSDHSIRASNSCGEAWEALVMGTDVEQSFASYAAMFCDCFDLLNAYYPSGLEWFECKALTTHQIAVKDLIIQKCYSPEVIANDCVSEAMRYASLLAVNRDVRGALTAFQAMRQGAVSDTLTDSLNELFCYSWLSGVTLGLAEADMFQFQMCEDVTGYSWNYETNCLSDDEGEVDAKIKTITEASIFTTGGSGEYWKTQLTYASVGTLVGCVLFGFTGYKYGKLSKPQRSVFTSRVPYAQVDE